MKLDRGQLRHLGSKENLAKYRAAAQEWDSIFDEWYDTPVEQRANMTLREWAAFKGYSTTFDEALTKHGYPWESENGRVPNDCCRGDGGVSISPPAYAWQRGTALS